MYYIFESIIVGIYSVILYFILSQWITNKYVLLFFTGICKHLFGYYLYIHDYYCNYGYACKKITRENKKYSSKSSVFIIMNESIIEGLLYLSIGSFFSLFILDNMFICVFIIGVLLHIMSELFHVHTFFCKYKCK
jgi:hypothetical protein